MQTEAQKRPIPLPVRVLLGIFGPMILLLGFLGFICSAGRGMNNQAGMFYKQRSLNEVNGIAVDSQGFIYIGENESSCIQVYARDGVFQYGFYFPTGGSGWFAFGIDGTDQVHVVTARAGSHYVFRKGELIQEEKIDGYNASAALQEKYHMTDAATCQKGEKTYRVTAFRRLKIIDRDGETSSLNLHAPIWPFSIPTFWLLALLGGGMTFLGLADSIFPGGILPAKKKKWRFRIRCRENFTITTDKSAQEVCDLLREITVRKRTKIFTESRANIAFWGPVEQHTFRISPILNYSGSAPVLTGEITEDQGQTKLNIRARFPVFTTVFQTVWMAFCGLMACSCVVHMIVNGYRGMLLVPFLLLLFGFAFFHFSFWHAVNKARLLLEQALA